MAEMQRQCGNSSSSKVADQDKQVESTMNINECASCTTQALHWRDASDAGRMEMNECLFWWVGESVVSVKDDGQQDPAKYMYSPSAKPAFLGVAWRATIHTNQHCSTCCRRWQSHGVDQSTPPQYIRKRSDSKDL